MLEDLTEAFTISSVAPNAMPAPSVALFTKSPAVDGSLFALSGFVVDCFAVTAFPLSGLAAWSLFSTEYSAPSECSCPIFFPFSSFLKKTSPFFSV
jgi:hypothetical protein